MSVRCGNRSHRGLAHHASASEVRLCYQYKGLSSLEELEEANRVISRADSLAEDGASLDAYTLGKLTQAVEEAHRVEENSPAGVLRQQAESKAEIEAEQSIERHLENAGYEEARADEAREAASGAIPFEEAYASVRNGSTSDLVVVDELTGFIEGQPQPADGENWPKLDFVPDGTYTVELGSEHQTFRVRTQDADEAFAPGKQIISYLSGADNESDYTGFAFIAQTKTRGSQLRVWGRFKTQHSMIDIINAAQALIRDPEAHLKAAQCSRCHRTLTVPASLYAGMGPDCAKKAG